MSLLPPKRLRILMIPEDQSASREYTISRRMILALGLLLGAVLALVVFVLISYGAAVQQARNVPRLERELARSQERLATVRELEGELLQMRSLQEKLLVMLGIEAPLPANRDTLAGDFTYGAVPAAGEPPAEVSTAEGLHQAAALVMTPPPDLWPASGFVTRPFQKGDTVRGVIPHEGIDIAGPTGSEIRAAGKGQVTRARWDDFLGNFVEIRHGFGYVTVYGHCDRLAVREGDRVDRGQRIGYLGASGEASAPHLHFEVWKDGVAVDPKVLLPGDPPR